MSIFGDNTLEQKIYELCHDAPLSDGKITKALLRVAGYFNYGLDADTPTIIE
jgi:hypothetical protein